MASAFARKHLKGEAMKTFLFSIFVSLSLSASLFAERPIPYFVSTQWLNDHLKDKDLVLLQVAFSRSEYSFAHLPGARFLWFESLAPSNPELSTEMPAVDQAKPVLEGLGITPNSKIVLVFNGGNVTIATRMILALTYFGFGDRVALLDGGLPMWKSEGRSISKETPAVERSSLMIEPHPNVITDADWVKDHLSSPDVSIVDARSKTFYDGNGGGVARQGHIKGAKSIPYSTIVDSTNKVKSLAELQKMFDEAGIKKGNTVVTYCHVGQQATLVYLAAKYLGYNAMVYDGCFEDWNVRDESYPVEKTEAAKK